MTQTPRAEVVCLGNAHYMFLPAAWREPAVCHGEKLRERGRGAPVGLYHETGRAGNLPSGGYKLRQFQDHWPMQRAKLEASRWQPDYTSIGAGSLTGNHNGAPFE